MSICRVVRLICTVKENGCFLFQITLSTTVEHRYNKMVGTFVYPARALRALGLLLADGAPTVRGGRFFDGSTVFFFFTKTAVTWEWKVEKSFLKWEMNGLTKSYKQAVDQNWGHMAKIGFLGLKPKFWAQ